MTWLGYAAASLRYYWRTSLASAAGVALAVATLGGALLVGTSVQASLRELALARLGSVHALVSAHAPVTETLATRLGGAPVLAVEGAVTHEASGRRATGVAVYGVDDRFWVLQQASGVSGLSGRSAWLSPALAAELGIATGDGLLIRVQRPSAIPAGVLQGRRDDPGRAVRVQAARVLPREAGGEFSPTPRQGDARAVFVPLSRLQRDLDLPGATTLIALGPAHAAGAASADPASAETTALDATALDARVARAASLEDRGLRLRALPGGGLSVEAAAGYLTPEMAGAAQRAIATAHGQVTPVLTYLATAIRANGRQTPYSLVSALPEETVRAEAQPAPVRPAPRTAPGSSVDTASTPGPTTATHPSLWLSGWAAADLEAHAGDTVTLDYFLWSDEAGLTTHHADFTLAGVLPMEGLAVDRDLTPEYPGVSTSEAIADWDPPFPVDLSRVRPFDEDYWREYRTAPKAFVRLEDGQRLWRSRYGQVTSLRVTGLDEPALRAALDAGIPASLAGLTARPVRAEALAASGGTTDFGEYFGYFSAFVVAASLLLAALFFRLGVEQRAGEAGTLAAFGLTPAQVARLLLIEAGLLVAAGTVAGKAGAVGFTALMLTALRTIWVGAVGTTALHLRVAAPPLLAGALGGALASLLCLVVTLRSLQRASVRALMAGTGEAPSAPGRPGVALVLAVAALTVAGAGLSGRIPVTAAFFSSGLLLLIAGLAALAWVLRVVNRRFLAPGRLPLFRLALRNAGVRPARTLLSVALVAGASFILVAVGAFRLGEADDADARGGTGGYQLIAESAQPLMHDPASAAGREALGLDATLTGLGAARFRLRPGDDASCANLYRPTVPRLLGATPAFLAEGRFTFTSSLATTPEDRANPWRLLEQPTGQDRVVPVIADATSLAYTFHAAVGRDLVIEAPDGGPLTLRVVGALRDSVLQSELVMSEAQFTRWFPREDGYRVFLMTQIPRRDPAALTAALERQLGDFGFDAQPAAARLAAYHRVENTYLSTFQALGGFGLVLGTLGLGTVLLRSVLERRRELALLRVTGFERRHLVRTVLAESACVLGAGLVLGVSCAFVAILPAYRERGEGLPLGTTAALLAAVALAGLLSTMVATRAVTRQALREGLTGE